MERITPAAVDSVTVTTIIDDSADLLAAVAGAVVAVGATVEL